VINNVKSLSADCCLNSQTWECVIFITAYTMTKTFLTGTAFFALITISFVSCEKEYSFEGSPQQNIADSTYLTEYMVFDASAVSGADTIWISELIYDGKKRNTLINEYNFGSTGARKLLRRYRFGYNGNDTEPIMMIFTDFVSSTNSPMTDTTYLKFTGSTLTHDSITYYTSFSKKIITTRYSHFNGRIVREMKSVYVHSNVATPITEAWKDTAWQFRDGNGNVIRQTDTTYSGALLQVADYRFSYDSRSNPFLKTMARLTSHTYPRYNLSTEPSSMFERNNPIEIKQTAGADRNHLKFTYKYNSLGLPIQTDITNVLDPQRNSTAKYIYKKF
jgi:hypothetical protein